MPVHQDSSRSNDTNCRPIRRSHFRVTRRIAIRLLTRTQSSKNLIPYAKSNSTPYANASLRKRKRSSAVNTFTQTGDSGRRVRRIRFVRFVR